MRSRVRTPPASYSPGRASGYRSGVVEPEVVIVAAGDALLGDPPRTEHVNVFAIAKTPVRVAEFAEFLEATKQPAPSTWMRQREHAEGSVEDVRWADAVAYCRWLTTGTGRIYRLPDEREWEKAARKEGTLEELGPLREWTNSWEDGARVLRTGAEPSARVFASGDFGDVGFRVVRGMTGR